MPRRDEASMQAAGLGVAAEVKSVGRAGKRIAHTGILVGVGAGRESDCGLWRARHPESPVHNTVENGVDPLSATWAVRWRTAQAPLCASC